MTSEEFKEIFNYAELPQDHTFLKDLAISQSDVTTYQEAIDVLKEEGIDNPSESDAKSYNADDYMNFKIVPPKDYGPINKVMGDLIVEYGITSYEGFDEAIFNHEIDIDTLLGKDFIYLDIEPADDCFVCVMEFDEDGFRENVREQNDGY